MRLRIILPDRLCLDAEVRRIVAEAPEGAFGILPGHIDFVSQLVPGILTFEDMSGHERYAGIHAGTLVKVMEDVRVATAGAIVGDDLRTVRLGVLAAVREEEEQEQTARAAFARLEAQMVRHFLQLEQGP